VWKWGVVVGAAKRRDEFDPEFDDMALGKNMCA
jgi:hypothetical protein